MFLAPRFAPQGLDKPMSLMISLQQHSEKLLFSVKPPLWCWSLCVHEEFIGWPAFWGHMHLAGSWGGLLWGSGIGERSQTKWVLLVGCCSSKAEAEWSRFWPLLLSPPGEAGGKIRTVEVLQKKEREEGKGSCDAVVNFEKMPLKVVQFYSINWNKSQTSNMHQRDVITKTKVPQHNFANLDKCVRIFNFQQTHRVWQKD